MLKYLVLMVTLCVVGLAESVTQPIVSVDGDKATIHIDNIQVGISGFVQRDIDSEHTTIIKSAVVTAFNPQTQVATLELSEYTNLKQDALPSYKDAAHVGDKVTLAYGYSRALLIAPEEEIYHRVTKAAPALEWVHPDIFASILSTNGHPTPLRSDFTEVCNTAATGLLYFYIDQNLFTLDCKSFTLLNISAAPLNQDKTQLPFYSRVESINANWFGEGHKKLTAYAPYYFELMVQNNKTNPQLYKFIKENEPDLKSLLSEFELKD